VQATVLLPEATIAPATSSRACRQTLFENSGLSGAKTCIIVFGRVRISITSFGRLR
jgi:hypothetical protein